MLRVVIFLMLFIFTAQIFAAEYHDTVNAQNDTLVGLVVNEKNKGIKNIPITVKHKDGVVRTDRKGIFVVPNVSLFDTVTMIVPKNKIFVVPISGMSFLKITMREDKFTTVAAKDEILDSGYGSVKKSRSTSGDVVISGDDLRETGQRDIISALSGKVAGLNIGYAEDGSQTVSLRGGSSLSSNNSPLFIIDGVTVSDLDHVNMNDVQQVTVMKEASIYGSHGANGAIIVKTK